MTDLREWIAMFHMRPAFRNGLTNPFSRPAFFGPPDATPKDFDTDIVHHSDQFAVIAKSLPEDVSRLRGSEQENGTVLIQSSAISVH